MQVFCCTIILRAGQMRRELPQKQWQEYMDAMEKTKEQLSDEIANQGNSNFENARHPYFRETHRHDGKMYSHYDWNLEKSGEYKNQMKAIWNLTTMDYIPIDKSHFFHVPKLGG